MGKERACFTDSGSQGYSSPQVIPKKRGEIVQSIEWIVLQQWLMFDIAWGWREFSERLAGLSAGAAVIARTRFDSETLSVLRSPACARYSSSRRSRCRTL